MKNTRNFWKTTYSDLFFEKYFCNHNNTLYSGDDGYLCMHDYKCYQSWLYFILKKDDNGDDGDDYK